MAKTVSVNYTDTAGGAAHGITIPSVNFGADFRIQKQTPSEVVISNMTSPMGYPEKVRFAASEVTDVYSGTTVDSALYAPSRKGVSFLCQLTDTYTVSDGTDPTYEVALPMEAHLVCKVPSNSNVTAAMVATFLSRLVATLFETDDTTMTNRVDALLHMSPGPTDL